MSDQAILWKFAFGFLVLLFCGAAWLVRRDAPPPSAMEAGAPVRVAPPTAPLPSASAPSLLREPAPADMPEAQETPVRIRISMAEPPPERRRPQVKAHRHLRPVALAKPHRHRAKHAKAAPPRYVSPYAIGRKHYPLDAS